MEEISDERNENREKEIRTSLTRGEREEEEEEEEERDEEWMTRRNRN